MEIKSSGGKDCKIPRSGLKYANHILSFPQKPTLMIPSGKMCLPHRFPL